MKNIITIVKKELKDYFDSAIAYIAITVFLIAGSWLFFRVYFINRVASMRGFFEGLPWIFSFFIPAITMRIWAEEKKSGTIELLLTYPVKDYEAVLGKFISSFIFLAIIVGLTITIPISIFLTGNPDPGPIVGQYLGTLMIGALYIAIGCLISAMSRNQIVAFISSSAIIIFLLIIGQNFFLMALPGWIVPILKFIGISTHFEALSRGVIDSRDVLYYLSVSAFFIYLNIKVIEGRQWK